MANKKYLSRTDILDADDLLFEDVEVPEWGDGIVRMRGLTAEERDEYEASVVKTNTTRGRGGRSKVDVRVDTRNIRAKLVSRCAVDGDGKRLFSDSDVQRLGKKSGKALQRCFSVAQRLSGITDSDIEEMVKNSETAQDDDSPSDSAKS